MTSLNVSLPEELQEFVDEQVARGNYDTASEYIRELLVRAREEQTEQDRIEALLLKSLETPARPMTPEEWEAIRREGMARLAKHAAP